MNDSKTNPQTEAQLLPLAEAGDMNAALDLAELYLDTHNPDVRKWAKTLCDNNMPEGYYLLGKCYEQGIAVDVDRAEAERLYRKSAAMGFPRALTGIVSLLFADPAKRKSNLPEIIRLLKKAVDQGDDKAMYILSILYKSGYGVERSKTKQRELLRRSARLGFVPAMSAYGEICLSDDEHREEGIELLCKAMELGDATAEKILLSNLSVREYYRIFKKDALQRKDQMIVDAEAGDPEAQYQLGISYVDGKTADGILFHMDLDKGREWLEKAALQGHDMASYTLGVRDAQLGDYEGAIRWYLRPASNGMMEAVTNLGVAYGSAGQVDKAVMWLKKGMEMGDVMAMSKLATHYLNGDGVPLDEDEAIRLYTAAAEAGDEYARLCLVNLNLLSDNPDVRAAEATLIKLVDAGYTPARTDLARIYLGGYGEEFIDHDMAESLLASAANRGDHEASYLLGMFYYHFKGNTDLSYQVFSRAASYGNQKAKTALRDLFGV